MTATGVSVCMDEAVLRPGDNWHSELPRHLRASAVVVALVSASTADATFEIAEVLLAIDQVRREGGRLVPIRLHPAAELPYGMQALQALDYFADDVAPTIARAIADVVHHPAKLAPLAATQVWCSRVPAVPAVFTGRDALLERVRASTSGGATAVLTQTIQGMGGVGKTTAAAALAEVQRRRLDVVWWVRAEQPSVLVADLAELAPKVGVAASDDLAATALAVRDWLEATVRSWLVVFDNVADEASVNPWRPRRGIGATVITSRNRNMGRLGQVIPVDTFADDVAEGFLRERVRTRNPAAAAEDLGALLARLGGLPLALEQAAAWVERVPNRRFAGYLRLFDDAAREPFPDGTRPLAYEQTATTTWRVSVNAAAAEASCAPRVLSVLGFLGPDDVPCAWLRSLAESRDPYLDASAPQVDEGLAALHGYSLAEISPADAVSVHRVIQSAARRVAPPEAARCAVALLRAQTDGEAVDPTHWATLATLVPHALAATATAGAALPDGAGDLSLVLNDITTYHRSRGANADAIAVGKLAVEFSTTHLGPDHLDTIRSRSNLASAYWSAGDLHGAAPLLEAILADSERLLGPDHPATLRSRNDLATAYYAAGDLGQAVALFEACLAESERVLGPDHPDTLRSRSNLAYGYMSAGDLGRAVPIYEATVADSERILGPDDVQTIVIRSNLASAYLLAGNLGRAVPLYEATLAHSERVLGPDHPHTLRSRNDLANAYRSIGDLTRAVPLLEATLGERERVLGSDHPDTLASRHEVARAYAAAGELGRAVPLLQAALAEHERALGPDHPRTLIIRDDLAAAHSSAGDSDRAVRLYRSTVADSERVLGPDHPSTLASRHNLARTYRSAGDLDRAVPLFELTLADHERVLGRDHPGTLICRRSLAGAYSSAGDLRRAVAVYEATLADSERVLGPDHPDTLTTRTNLAIARQALEGCVGSDECA